jgi:urease accessory protein
MSAPAAASRPSLAPPLAPGEGRLRFARVDGATTLVGCAAATPLGILAPRRRGASGWAVLASHGGGLVAGDTVALDVDVGAGAAALVSTQAETKVYRSAGGAVASQQVDARIAAGGALALVPEPVSPFAGARYEQRQRFDLAAGASLLLVDAVVAGRTARGERWAFERYATRNSVRVGGRLVVADALVLAPRAPGELALRLGAFDAFAAVVALGPAFARVSRSILADVEALPVAPGAAVLAAASPVDGGAFLRCASRSAEALAEHVRRAIAPAGEALGDPGFAHRW